MLKPFMLEPTYRDYVWGGNRLRPESEITAEAWVVYEQDKIKSGPYKGKTLAEAAEAEGESLLGYSAVSQTGYRFPLLIKLLDSARWISLQVHPNDEQAKKLEGPGHFGKTESWYVVQADEGAQLLSGIKEGVTHEQIKEAVGKKDILDLVVHRKVQLGDYLFMSPGTIHALGPGLLIYEVQQTSDITYRVYDWDRPRKNGRKLHIEQAIEVLDPSARGEVHHSKTYRREVRQDKLISCKFFSLGLISGSSGSISINTHGNSFSALTNLEGSIKVYGEAWSLDLNPYQSILVPAECGEFSISATTQVRALNAFVPTSIDHNR